MKHLKNVCTIQFVDNQFFVQLKDSNLMEKGESNLQLHN